VSSLFAAFCEVRQIVCLMPGLITLYATIWGISFAMCDLHGCCFIVSLPVTQNLCNFSCRLYKSPFQQCVIHINVLQTFCFKVSLKMRRTEAMLHHNFEANYSVISDYLVYT